jgi:hypothetical protein
LCLKNVKIRIYKTIILPVVLYGCETWSPTLREAHRLKVFENREVKRIFGPKSDEVIGGWRKLQNGELYNLYYSQVKEDEMGWACSTHGKKRSPYRILEVKQEENRPLGRPRSRWVFPVYVIVLFVPLLLLTL